MVKEGRRPVTIPDFKGEMLPIGLTQAILRQADIDLQ
jgi:predicted RNA binding protein YcfA (HicA-like mRNA interferase family)